MKPIGVPSQLVVVTHEFVPGAPQELLAWALRQQIPDIALVGHPLYWHAGGRSVCHRWINGRPEAVCSGPIEPKRDALRYVLHSLLTAYWVTRAVGPGAWIVAAGPLNAAAAVPARYLRRRVRLIYYTIDFVPFGRFTTSWLNAIYRRADSVAVRASDIVWNLTQRMAEARKSLGLAPRYRNRQIVVPIGTHARAGPGSSHSGRPLVGFIGHIRENQGVDIFVRAMAQVRARLPEASALIIGDGPEMPGIRALVSEMGLDAAIEFTGLITDRPAWEKRLEQCALAVAPYRPIATSLTYYADPTKPKDYLALGLPVLITDVPEVAREIERAGAGAIVEYDAASLAAAIQTYLSDRELLRKARAAARDLAERWRWDAIFPAAVEESSRRFNAESSAPGGTQSPRH